MQAGNLAAARAHFDRSLQVAEGLAKADPTSAHAQRDLSVSLSKLKPSFGFGVTIVGLYIGFKVGVELAIQVGKSRGFTQELYFSTRARSPSA